eukprot:TRINITY_DN22986_c0_g1_i2.p1 TRINITY_DN22986_c0_g1~~TRINITY_DN22986_c0_g1_i2.p1  ORF type:complete len:233 (-),score=70.05 TRINITY_DN22986_c0_g1_i2:588-1286(-)
MGKGDGKGSYAWGWYPDWYAMGGKGPPWVDSKGYHQALPMYDTFWKGVAYGKSVGKGKGKGGLVVDGQPKKAKNLIRSLTASHVLPGGKGWQNDANTLFVGGLPDDTTDLDLYTIFAPFGAIAPRGVSARLDEKMEKCTGIGFVNYLEAAATQKAINTLHGTLMSDGSRLTVSIKQAAKPKGDGKGAKSGKGKASKAAQEEEEEEDKDADASKAEDGDDQATDAKKELSVTI